MNLTSDVSHLRSGLVPTSCRDGLIYCKPIEPANHGGKTNQRDPQFFFSPVTPF